MEALPITPWFACASRDLRRACRHLGLDAPSFRSPPAVPGVDRTLRRVPGEEVRVAVRLWGRSFSAIRADMVEGVLATNHLPATHPLRRRLEEVAPIPEQVDAA